MLVTIIPITLYIAMKHKHVYAISCFTLQWNISYPNIDDAEHQLSELKVFVLLEYIDLYPNFRNYKALSSPLSFSSLI